MSLASPRPLGRTSPIALLATAALSLAAGCADGSSGALEQSEIAVDCRPGDVDCADLGLDRAVAVGASVVLDVGVASPGAATPPLVLRSTDDAVLAVDGARVTATGPGLTALLFLAEGSGDVVDFVHAVADTADALALSVRGGDDGAARPVEGPIQLLVGDELHLAAQPVGGGVVLAGEPASTWSLAETPSVPPDDDGETAAVVTLLETGFGGERRLVARGPGIADVTVDALGLRATVTVEVLP